MSWTRLLRPTWARFAAFVVFLVVGVLFAKVECADQIGPAGQHVDRCSSSLGPMSGPVWWLILPIGAYLLATLVTWRTDSSRGNGAA